MNNDFIEPWQKMIADWQKAQTSITEKMMDNVQKWNDNINNSDNNDTSYYNNNPLLDVYQSFLESILKKNPEYNLYSSHHWNDVLKTFPGSEPLVKQVNDLIKGSKLVFEKIKQDFIDTLPNDSTRDYFLTALDDISNPYNWLKHASTDFDEGVKRFSEGPLFSGISDIDNRIAKAMDGWLDLGEKNNDYYEVLLKNWTKAYERFLEHIETISDQEKQDLSPRKLIELWSSIADKEMMAMHRSDDFLQAQQALIKASAEYRLYEQDIAEVICEAMHVPTRQEVDDLHKTVTNLRREIRSLKTTLSTIEKNQLPQEKPAVSKEAPKTKKAPTKTKRVTKKASTKQNT